MAAANWVSVVEMRSVRWVSSVWDSVLVKWDRQVWQGWRWIGQGDDDDDGKGEVVVLLIVMGVERGLGCLVGFGG